MRLFMSLPPAMRRLRRGLAPLGFDITASPHLPDNLLDFEVPKIQVVVGWRKNLRLKVVNLKKLGKNVAS